MNDKLATYEEVQHERDMLDRAVDDFLRRKGWVHTSSTPGSYWLWCKTVKWTEFERDYAKGGFKERSHTKEVMTDKDTALSIQRALDNGKAT